MENVRVLVVDDSALDRDSISAGLREYGSHVVVSKNGNEALSCLKNNTFDVAVIDLILPDIYGIELLEHIKATDPRMEVIIVTAYASVDSSIKALDCGAFAYFIKPVEVELLILYVKRALEKQRSAENLRESEMRFKNLLEAVTAYIYTVHIEDGVVVKTEHGTNCLAVTGYTAEEYALDPELWYCMIYEEDRAKVVKNTNDFLSGKKVWPVEHRIYHKSGRIVWVSDTVVPRYDTAGVLCSYDGLVRDITTKKEAEEALRKSEASLVNAQQIARMGSWDWIIPTGELYWSDEVYNIFGVVKGEYKPSYDDFISRVHPDDRDLVESAVESALASNTQYFVEHRIVREDGVVLVVYEQAELIYDHKGRPMRMSGTVQDITEYKKRQEMLFLTTKLASIGELAASVAHEINNPMTAVLGYTSLLLEEAGEKSEYYNDLKVIEKEGVRIKEIVRQLLDFARNRQSKKRKTDINYLLRQTVELVEHMAECSDIKIFQKYQDGLPEIIADPDQIRQVFLNIITNSCHAIKEGGRIDVETRMSFNHVQEREELHIIIKDSGIGMKEEVAKNIFDPFFTTKGENGTGLGLSVSFGLVRNHGGDITVETCPEKGSAFTVILPIEGQANIETHIMDSENFF